MQKLGIIQAINRRFCKEPGLKSQKGLQQMEKAKTKYRDISFFSEKNQTMMCVHSRRAREYADLLEQVPEVASYQTSVPPN